MSKKEELQRAAERFVRRSGFNTMSFADLAKEVGIKTASVHYHFPTKTDLGVALIAHYHAAFFCALNDKTKNLDSPSKRIKEFASLFESEPKEEGRLCLCGMLATELPSLDVRIKRPVRDFFEACKNWLSKELKAGQQMGEFQITKPTPQVAATFFAALEGAMLVARTLEDPKHIKNTVSFLISAIEV